MARHNSGELCCHATALVAYATTKTQISFAVTAKLISVFVFATWIVQSLFYLNPKFQASSYLCGFTAWFVSDLVGNPEDRFSHNETQMSSKDADRIADTADLDQIYTVFDLSLHMINIMNCKVNRHRINTALILQH